MLGIAAPCAARSGGGKTRVSTSTDSMAFDMILSPIGDSVCLCCCFITHPPPYRRALTGTLRKMRAGARIRMGTQRPDSAGSGRETPERRRPQRHAQADNAPA
ncbi:hypothetical protein G6F58_013428 [Rhizopus delemar]|nr:hypothetical protein G6F58_013428 [Rhizopus delemar]